MRGESSGGIVQDFFVLSEPAAIDQRTLYEGNSVLRGGQTPRIEQPGRPDDLQII
jgi:hypothetical protein